MSDTDRIEKTVVLRAPRARVWRALADSKEFGAWFGVALEGPFVPGARVRGKVTKPPGYEHVPFELAIERVEPERLFSFRWHPYAIDPAVDYSGEPPTLVVLTLDEVPEGTKLSVVETGFDAIPAHRRAEAFRMNTHGWGAQLDNIGRHVQSAL